MFIATAVDLYRTNPAYRAELDAERDGPAPEPGPQPVTVTDRLDELAWLLDGGVSVHWALTQTGFTLEAAQAAALTRAHPVHARLLPESVGLSDWWASEWLAGRAA